MNRIVFVTILLCVFLSTALLAQKPPQKPKTGQKPTATKPKPIAASDAATTGPGGLPLRRYKFDVVTVNSSGTVTKRRKGKARYYVEHIGGVALEMVEISGGTFLMGSTDAEADQVKREYERNGYDAEGASKASRREVPQHSVSVPTFYMGKFEATQAQWRVVSRLPKVNKDLVSDPSSFNYRGYSLPASFIGDSLPVQQVSWEDAIEFCERLSRATGRTYRLPTEAEWEYAARGGTTTPFYFGVTITPELVNYDGNKPYGSAPKGISRETTTPVGSLSYPNAFGLYDMHGNVWEWCMDYWHESYNGAPTDGSSWDTAVDTLRRVIRGSSYNHDGNHNRAAMRLGPPATAASPSLGFRVVAEAQQTAPGQRQIVFDSKRDGTQEIYVMDPDGSNQQRLTRALAKDGSWHPAWSPDGKKIAFSSNRDGNSELYLMDADGSNVKRLTHTAGERTGNMCADWSPDGRRIAFCSSGEIYVMDADGSNLWQLTHMGADKARSANPDWSPDGQQILFASTRDGKVHNWDESEIYVMASDGANVRRLTRTPGKGNWTPRWHPDGKKIIFASNRGAESAERSEIYVMHADGSNVRQLTTHESLAARPHWSPDGKKVVYHYGNSKDWSDHEIYVMDADGSNVRRLTFNKAIDGHPAW